MQNTSTTRRTLLKGAGLSLAGLTLGLPALGATMAAIPQIDSGAVRDGRVQFPNWRSDADVPGPPPPAPLPPAERVGFAIVGLGRLSLEQILPAFAESKLAKPVAVVSGTPDKAKLVAAQYGIAPEAIYDYQSFDRIADNKDIQAVYIVLPNALHKEFTLRAAAAGKHVLCEKPMATSVADAVAMVAACVKAQRKLMIAYRCQYEPANRHVIELARNGSLGDLRLIHAVNTQSMGDPAQWRLRKALAGGGALPDIGLYCLNAARAITGEEPVEIFARSVQPQGDPRFAEVEATIDFTLRFQSGVLASCQSSYDAYNRKDLSLNLSRGAIELKNAFEYEGQRLSVAQRQDELAGETEYRVPRHNQFALELDHFADCIRRDRQPHTPGEEGLADQRLMAALYESARSGKPVTLPKVASRDIYRGPALEQQD